MPDPHRHADDIIRRLSRRRKAHACYPCAKRKVRCNGGSPCSVCKMRGHPEICFYRKLAPSQSVDSDSDAARDLLSPTIDMLLPTPGPAHGSANDSADADGIDLETAGSNIEHARPDPVFTIIGDLSSAHYVQHALSPRTPQADIRSGLGLTNVSSFGAAGSRERDLQRSQIITMLPSRGEILRFLHPFRADVAPFHPVFPNIDAIELGMHKLLDDTDHDWSERPRIRAAEVALYLSVLAVGAQFADAPTETREKLSQNLIDRCDACLRLARYTANPSPGIVQTLILIGFQAQNAGRSDEAWSLLGLTFRLAQSLGMEGQTEDEQHFLWSSILWQDALLSLRYDRKPMYSRRLELAWPDANRDADYFCCMLNICRLTREYLLSDGTERCGAAAMQHRVTNITAIENSAANFLKDAELCTNVVQRLKFYALRMHTSYLTSEMCRPFLGKSATTQTKDNVAVHLRSLGISRLQRTIEAYLSMSQLSNLPLRSWSLTFEAFTAVCVLTVLELRRTLETIDSLLSKFQLFLERELTNEEAPEEAVTYPMLRRGRQLLEILDSSKRRGPHASAADLNANQVTSGSLMNTETMNEESVEFEAFYDRFWETDPFSEPDGTLLSMFDPFYNDIPVDDADSTEDYFGVRNIL